MNNEQENKTPANLNGNDLNLRPNREEITPTNAKHPTKTPQTNPNTNPAQNNSTTTSYLSKTDVYSQTFHIEQNLHTRLLPVTQEQVECFSNLKNQTPEIYQALIDTLKIEAETDAFERRSRFTVPADYARRGQHIGAIIVTATLGIICYAMHLNITWIAALFGVIDLVALAASFGANQKPKER